MPDKPKTVFSPTYYRIVGRAKSGIELVGYVCVLPESPLDDASLNIALITYVQGGFDRVAITRIDYQKVLKDKQYESVNIDEVPDSLRNAVERFTFPVSI